MQNGLKPSREEPTLETESYMESEGGIDMIVGK
jgi:hypothetical protein